MQRRALIASMVLMGLAAGCTAPPTPIAPEPPSPPPSMEQATIDMDVHVGTKGACATVGCFGGGRSTTVLLRTPANQSAVSIHLDLGAAELVEGPVEWKLGCDPAWPGCERPLGHGHQELPFTIDLQGFRVPPGMDLLLDLWTPVPHPAANTYVLDRTSRATGTIGLEVLPVDSLLPVAPVAFRVSLDGHSGPCNTVEANCTHWPGGSVFDFPDLSETIVAVNLTMTWTSTNPLDQELGLTIWPHCSATCETRVLTIGTSPLVVAASDLRFASGVELEAHHPDSSNAIGRAPIGTRTPVHIEGVFWLIPEPEAE